MAPSTTPSAPSPEAVPHRERRLGPVGAVINALLNRRLIHYPRFPDDCGSWEKLPDEDAINRVAATLSNLEGENGNLEEALKRGRETLDEVKGLTEYQDQKATRLLTIITFLSALSGILFARFVESYPLYPALEHLGHASVEGTLLVATYGLFGVFVVLAICGALVTFHAIRTQFRYPDTQAGSAQRTKSYLFYKSIIEVTPEAWAQSFLADDHNKLAPDLKLRYVRNYIVESYLVAAKVADKLRYLQPAQELLSWSTRVLLVWSLIYGLTIALVPALRNTVPSVPVTSTVLVPPRYSPSPSARSATGPSAISEREVRAAKAPSSSPVQTTTLPKKPAGGEE